MVQRKRMSETLIEYIIQMEKILADGRKGDWRKNKHGCDATTRICNMEHAVKRINVL